VRAIKGHCYVTKGILTGREGNGILALAGRPGTR